MASIDDVSNDVARLLDALIRTKPDGMTPGMGQVGSFPGLVPRTYWAAEKGRQASLNILAAVAQIETLLNAVNEQTLSRIETSAGNGEAALSRVEIAISAANTGSGQTLARIESSLDQVWSFLPTVREDMGELRVLVESVSSDVQALSAKIDSLRADIQALPH